MRRASRSPRGRALPPSDLKTRPSSSAALEFVAATATLGITPTLAMLAAPFARAGVRTSRARRPVCAARGRRPSRATDRPRTPPLRRTRRGRQPATLAQGRARLGAGGLRATDGADGGGRHSRVATAPRAARGRCAAGACCCTGGDGDRAPSGARRTARHRWRARRHRSSNSCGARALKRPAGARLSAGERSRQSGTRARRSALFARLEERFDARPLGARARSTTMAATIARRRQRHSRATRRWALGTAPSTSSTTTNGVDVAGCAATNRAAGPRRRCKTRRCIELEGTPAAARAARGHLRAVRPPPRP